ncbi:uncharacterized protein LOC126899736 [Daktulosphaira vitifoliae]|uniref:uncharacterized protein LOC126899736 n=1 Tax=Daktulosphaira vitifoliae TaxID=58002 RepID=UPI0021A98C2F|nr:uncharacterized protein LOC126899736 [Daktulosphaira vitifoliae]
MISWTITTHYSIVLLIPLVTVFVCSVTTEIGVTDVTQGPERKEIVFNGKMVTLPNTLVVTNRDEHQMAVKNRDVRQTVGSDMKCSSVSEQMLNGRPTSRPCPSTVVRVAASGVGSEAAETVRSYQRYREEPDREYIRERPYLYREQPVVVREKPVVYREQPVVVRERPIWFRERQAAPSMLYEKPTPYVQQRKGLMVKPQQYLYGDDIEDDRIFNSRGLPFRFVLSCHTQKIMPKEQDDIEMLTMNEVREVLHRVFSEGIKAGEAAAEVKDPPPVIMKA